MTSSPISEALSGPLPNFLVTGPEQAPVTLVLAHGAGAPMDSPFMAAFAEGLGARGLRVARFEFPYMAARRREGRRKPPDREKIKPVSLVIIPIEATSKGK